AVPLLPEGNNRLDSPSLFGIGNFEIGRVLHLKSEIRNLKSDVPEPAAVSDAASKARPVSGRSQSNLIFRIPDLRCRTRPISKFPIPKRLGESSLLLPYQRKGI